MDFIHRNNRHIIFIINKVSSLFSFWTIKKPEEVEEREILSQIE